jgi:hypothetical protein
MTVESLEVAKDCVVEANGDIEVVYEYFHTITMKKLWSLESRYELGNTERSEYVVRPRIIYTRENGWSE